MQNMTFQKNETKRCFV